MERRGRPGCSGQAGSAAIGLCGQQKHGQAYALASSSSFAISARSLVLAGRARLLVAAADVCFVCGLQPALLATVRPDRDQPRVPAESAWKAFVYCGLVALELQVSVNEKCARCFPLHAGLGGGYARVLNKEVVDTSERVFQRMSDWKRCLMRPV